MKTITFIVAMAALALIFAVAMWKAKKEEKQKEEKLAKSLEFLANELELSNGERLDDVELLKLDYYPLLSKGYSDIVRILNYSECKMAKAQKCNDKKLYEQWSELHWLATAAYRGFPVE